MLTDFYGKSIGTGQCVPLVQQATGVGHTSTWSPGDAVVGNDSLTIGTPIATFDPNGRYGNHTNHTSHAAIYLGPGEAPGSIRVLDQWAGHPASERTIRPDGHSPVDQSGNYRVIVASNQRQVPGYSSGGQQPQSNPNYDELEQELRGSGGAQAPSPQPAAPTTAQPSQGASSGQYDQLEQELRGPGGLSEPQQAAPAAQATAGGATTAGNTTPAPSPQTTPAPQSMADTGTPLADALAPTVPIAATGPMVAGLGRMVHDMTDLPAWALAKLGDYTGINRLLGTPTGQQVAASNEAGRQQFEQQYGSNPLAQTVRIGGDIATTALPLGAIGRGVELGAKLVPGAAGSLVRLVAPAASGAAQGAAGTLLTAGASDQPLGEQLERNALLGGGLGAVAGGAGWAANKLLGGVSPERAQLARQAIDRGIPVNAAQISSSPAVRMLNDVAEKMPFSGATAERAARQAAWDRQLAASIGQNADNLTPPVMDAARKTIGGGLEAIENANNVTVSDTRLQQLLDLEDRAKSALTDAEAKVVSTQINNIISKIGNGDTISGEAFGNLIHKGSPLDDAINAGGNPARYAREAKAVLQGAMQDSLPSDVAARYSQLRLQWKNMKTIEPLAEKSEDGHINPTLLLNQVRQRFENMAYDTEPPDLVELARLGRLFVGPPSSGSAERAATYALYTGLGSIPAQIAAGQYGPAAMTGLTLGGTVGLGRAVGSLMRSDAYTNALINNALAGGPQVNYLTRYLPQLAAPGALTYQEATRNRQQ
jgi:hypothetical protein